MEALMIGTLFEEEEIDKKKNFYNQVARDEKGHKRFHGAFTGGFHAGYKDTVGSREGWAGPQQYQSSRTNRAKFKQQTVLDFMDDEDLGKTKVGETLVARDDYDTLGASNQELIKKNLGTSILGDAPEELLVSTKKSIGFQILNNMRKEKQLKQKMDKVNKLISEKEMRRRFTAPAPPVQEAAKYNLTFEFKEGMTGLGFDPLFYDMENDEEFFDEEFHRFSKSSQRKVAADAAMKEKEKRKNRISIDLNSKVNQYEDFSDEEYSKFELNADDLEKIDILKNVRTDDLKKRQMISSMKNLKEMFIKSDQPLKIKSIPVSQEVPENFDPYSKVKEFLAKNQSNVRTLDKSRYNMDPKARAEILEQGTSNSVSNFQKQLSEQTRAKIMGVKSFVKGGSQDMEGDQMSYLNFFKNDFRKQDRFKNFILEKQGRIVGGIAPREMSYSEIEREREEFEKAYISTLKPEEKEKIIDDIYQTIDKKKRSRTIEQWVPERLLCKRFGVNPPYKGKVASLFKALP